ncbi:MAG: (S)-ureidoglycine aminohydrolase [Planctomycetota bacterium]
MRPITDLVHSRTRVTPHYAVMPLEGFPPSRLPGWPDAEAYVLASPAIGADFVQLLIDLPAGSTGAFPADRELQTFHYVLAGAGQYTNNHNANQPLTPGAFGLTAPNHTCTLTADKQTPLRVLLLRKRYEPTADHPDTTPLLGHADDVEQTVWADNADALLQTLVPDDPAFDLAMNIFTFSPGHGLPIVETHVMEHGLWFLQGKGLYHLAGEWMEVEKDDFIWMAPFCPQSYYATGPTPTQYLYYKNVNRDISL